LIFGQKKLDPPKGRWNKDSASMQIIFNSQMFFFLCFLNLKS
jgi:hypothetical protein